MVIIKSVSSSQDKQTRSLLITADIEAHHLGPSALAAFATFQDHGRSVRSESKENSANGWLVGVGTATQTSPTVFTWQASVPAAALPNTAHRKLRARVYAGLSDSAHLDVLDSSSLVDVEFPKR